MNDKSNDYFNGFEIGKNVLILMRLMKIVGLGLLSLFWYLFTRTARKN